MFKKNDQIIKLLIIFSTLLTIGFVMAGCSNISNEQANDSMKNLARTELDDQESKKPSNTKTISALILDNISDKISATKPNENLVIYGMIKPVMLGDKSIQTKEYFLIDAHNNSLKITKINSNILGSLVLYPTVQRFQIEGRFVNHSGPVLEAADIRPIEYEEINPSGVSEYLKEEFCANENYIVEDEICDCDETEISYSGKCVEWESLNSIRQDFLFYYDEKEYKFSMNLKGGLRDSYRNYNYTTIATEQEWYDIKVGDEKQSDMYDKILTEFKNHSPSKSDLARMAVSFVQRIPYDFPGFLYDGLVNKFPYEVVYDRLGVCGDKSLLLIGLLKELGYGTAYFVFEEENHAAAGIKCNSEFDFQDSGYCFVESNTPNIITYAYGDYGIESGEKLSSIAKVYVISSGISLDVRQDFDDALELNKITTNAEKRGHNVLNEKDWNSYSKIAKRYGLN